jgi:hypothetical protein
MDRPETDFASGDWTLLSLRPPKQHARRFWTADLAYANKNGPAGRAADRNCGYLLYFLIVIRETERPGLRMADDTHARKGVMGRVFAWPP